MYSCTNQWCVISFKSGMLCWCAFQPHSDDSRYFNFPWHFMVSACHDGCTILSILNQETIKLHENIQDSILGW